MAARTQHQQAQAKVAETKKRSDANPRRRQRPAVEVRHVQPVRPDRSSFPSGVEGTHKYREAETAYETALLAYAAESGAPAEIADDVAALEAHFAADATAPALDLPKLDALIAPPKETTVLDPTDASGADGANGATDRKPRRRAPKLAPEETARRKQRQVEHADHEAQKATTAKAPRKAPAKSAPKATAATKAAKKATALPAPSGYKSWADPKLATVVVRMKTKEKKTIKAIAEALSLPAEHRSWFAVSKVWRETADAKGIDRPRLSAEAIEARKAKNSK